MVRPLHDRPLQRGQLRHRVRGHLRHAGLHNRKGRAKALKENVRHPAEGRQKHAPKLRSFPQRNRRLISGVLHLAMQDIRRGEKYFRPAFFYPVHIDIAGSQKRQIRMPHLRLQARKIFITLHIIRRESMPQNVLDPRPPQICVGTQCFPFFHPIFRANRGLRFFSKAFQPIFQRRTQAAFGREHKSPPAEVLRE